MESASTTQTEKFVVRFPNGMRTDIFHAATRCHRSMNAEIIARLQHSLSNWPASLPLQQTAIPAGDEEALLLERFRQLSTEKKHALLALLD